MLVKNSNKYKSKPDAVLTFVPGGSETILGSYSVTMPTQFNKVLDLGYPDLGQGQEWRGVVGCVRVSS
jgi:hypothetical protein